jgi:tetratricopeptide (TPR) repeat protein
MPDIRFLPPLIFALVQVLFAETLEPLLARARRPAAVFYSVLIFCGCMVSVIFGTTRADTWFRFNNMGYESMPGYTEFRSLNDSLRQVDRTRFADPLNAPRVGYEKSDLYGRYGGDRVFESLHFFSGRQTLEGIHYASSFASKPMAFLQTAFSRDIKTPVPYILSRMNPAGLPAYFDLYNVSQLILVSDEAKKAIQGSSLFEKEADFGPLSLYRYKDCQSLYVDLPKARPVLYAGKNWVGDFFQWYKAADRLDILMVPEAYVKSRLDRDALSVTISSLMELDSLKPVPLQREGLNVHTSLEPMGIRFTTSGIGVPHLIKVSYFPNWTVQGAEGVYPVSPHLMLVIPREKEVVLTYGRSLWDHVGMVITLGTLLFMIFTMLRQVGRQWRFQRKGNPLLVSPLSKGGDEGRDSRLSGNDGKTNPGLFSNRIRLALIALVLLAAASLIVAGAVLRNKPVRTYVNGYKHYQLGNQLLEAKKVEEANRSFRKAIAAMAPIVETRHLYDHQDVIHCLLFTAMSLERLGDTSKAETLYRTILQEYPYSRYTGECYVKIARGKKTGRDPSLEQALSALQRGNQAQALPSLKKALDQTERHLAFLKRALVEDPYSVWAAYAKQDLENEHAYLRPKLPLLRALCDDSEVQRLLSWISDEYRF